MCDLLNDNSSLLFGNASVAAPGPDSKRSFLELGSGIGRAGIMAAKLMSMYDSFDTCVLTDGKISRSLARQHVCVSFTGYNIGVLDFIYV